MPNCDFYVLGDDVEAVASVVLDAGCEVYELSSAPGHDVRRFTTVAELRQALATSVDRLLLQLYSPEMRGRVRFTRIDFDSDRVKGPAWRYDTRGWGLVQLYLGKQHGSEIRSSHTNHFSESRARKFEATGRPELGPIADWDWEQVAAVSRRINQKIRSLAAGKHGSRPVLPAAWNAVRSGAASYGL